MYILYILMFMKNLVVLTGGGVASSYQLGVLKELVKDYKIDAIVGTSGGALNASILSQNYGIENLERLWNIISTEGNKRLFDSKIIDVDSKKLNLKNLVTAILPSFKNTVKVIFSDKKYKDLVQANIEKLESLANTNPLKTLLSNNIELDEINIPLYFNVVDLFTGKEILLSDKDFETKEDLVDGIIASASIPILLNPIRVKTKTYVYQRCVDGGTSSNLPIKHAYDIIKNREDRKDWRIIVISCTDGKSEFDNSTGIVNYARRILGNIMLDALYSKDKKSTSNIDSFIEEMEEAEIAIKGKSYITIPTIIIEPTAGLGGFLDNTRILFNYRVQLGRENYNKFFNNERREERK